MTRESPSWNSFCDVPRALEILGLSNDEVRNIPLEHAITRCRGAWAANEPERFVAWEAIVASKL